MLAAIIIYLVLVWMLRTIWPALVVSMLIGAVIGGLTSDPGLLLLAAGIGAGISWGSRRAAQAPMTVAWRQSVHDR